MINETNIFDLQDIIFNELVGDVMLTVILGLIVVLLLSIKSKVPYQVSVLLGLLWLMMAFAGNMSLMIIWVFIVLFIGTLYYYGIAKIIRRG